MTETTTSDQERLQANHELVTQLIDKVNAKDFGSLAELVHPDYVEHDLAPGQPPGIPGLQMVYGAFAAAFPDIRYTIEDLVAEDDLVVARGSIDGTNEGPFMGIPPTGRRMHWTATRMFRIRDGRIVEGWLNMDMVGMLVQMGVIPPPPE
jgi:predicted ester cyclase